MASALKKDSYWREIFGIALICAALPIFLSLVSYEPEESFFIKEPPDPCTNWIGPVGLHGAWFALNAVGIAAYLLPLLSLIAASLVLWVRRFNTILLLILSVLILMSAAGLIDLPNYFMDTGNFLDSWCKQHQLERAGGLVGEQINGLLLVRFMGKAGSLFVLGGIYLSSLIILLQVRPLQLIRESGPWLWEQIYQWRLRRADTAKALELQKKKLEREQRVLARSLRKSGVEPSPITTSDENIPDPTIEVQRPEPKIIDTSTPLPRTTVSSKEQNQETNQELEPEPIPVRPLKPSVSNRKTKTTPTPNTALTTKPSPTFENYSLPPQDLLTPGDPSKVIPINTDELAAKQQLLIETLREFSIETSPGDITKGATITRYELYPARGVRVDRIISLELDIARAMKAEKVNILAPVPGKDSVAIELPNANKVSIRLRELFETPQWINNKAKIPLALGKDVYGETLVPDLAEMPHLLIAGTTGSGKSVCVNCIILSLLYRFSPDDLRIILVDPKVVEMQCYNHLPHLVVPVVTEPKKVLVALRWVINEMDKRYEIMARAGVRNIGGFNSRPKDQPKVEELDLPEKLADPNEEEISIESVENNNVSIASVNEETLPDRLPYIVVIVDELADLMQTAPKDVEVAIARLSAKARAAGIHLILATQTPRAQVITGVIKTNIPSRIAFQVPSSLDSRVILDDNGAENLLGKGDMLFLPPGSSKLVRAQGAFVSDEEVNSVVNFIRKRYPVSYESVIHQKLSHSSIEEDISDEDEELLEKCMEVIRQEKRASTSMLQRRLSLGYTRAARIMDILEKRGIVGPENGAKPREILVDLG